MGVSERLGVLQVWGSLSGTETTPHAFPRALQRFRQDAYLADDGHEVRVAVPPWHHVDMEVVLDARARGPALIDADVVAVGSILRAERDDRALDERHRIGELVDSRV